MAWESGRVQIKLSAHSATYSDRLKRIKYTDPYEDITQGFSGSNLFHFIGLWECYTKTEVTSPLGYIALLVGVFLLFLPFGMGAKARPGVPRSAVYLICAIVYGGN